MDQNVREVNFKTRLITRKSDVYPQKSRCLPWLFVDLPKQNIDLNLGLTVSIIIFPLFELWKTLWNSWCLTKAQAHSDYVIFYNTYGISRVFPDVCGPFMRFFTILLFIICRIVLNSQTARYILLIDTSHKYEVMKIKL